MITPERIERFLARVRNVRYMQREYRRTLDSRLRHQLPAAELDLDNDAELLAAELLAVAGAVEQLTEGGGA